VGHNALAYRVLCHWWRRVWQDWKRWYDTWSCQ